MKRLLAIFSATVLMASCSTDFDIIGPYKDNTIVFGLLDKNENIHFIKVNKSFLGPGNAYDYAAIKDSSEYANVSGVVEEWHNGALTATYVLHDTTIQNRDSGLFYYPEQTLYYFTANLVQNREYRLHLNINDGAKEVSGATNLVDEIIPGITLSASAIRFANFNSSIAPYVYPDNNTVKYRPGNNTRRVDIWLLFWYDEYTASGVTRKKLEWKIDSYVTATTNGTEPDRQVTVAGDRFYQFIQTKLDPDPNVIKRTFRQIDFQFVSVSDDLYTFMKLTEPSTGIVQERPAFTNLDNALGIFSSRMTKNFRGKFLDKDSQRELCQGQYTGNLQFCSDSLVWNGESFYCP